MGVVLIYFFQRLCYLCGAGRGWVGSEAALEIELGDGWIYKGGVRP